MQQAVPESEAWRVEMGEYGGGRGEQAVDGGYEMACRTALDRCQTCQVQAHFSPPRQKRLCVKMVGTAVNVDGASSPFNNRGGGEVRSQREACCVGVLLLVGADPCSEHSLGAGRGG